MRENHARMDSFDARKGVGPTTLFLDFIWNMVSCPNREKKSSPIGREISSDKDSHRRAPMIKLKSQTTSKHRARWLLSTLRQTMDEMNCYFQQF